MVLPEEDLNESVPNEHELHELSSELEGGWVLILRHGARREDGGETC